MLDRMGNDIWTRQGEYYQEPWTSLRWCSRPNQAGECLHLWHLLCLFSLSYTISLGSWFMMYLIQLKALYENF
ncbi:hypothetical protein PTKIN_Ptkin15bG0115000 [Pterospermum kingtungense]